MSSADGNKGAGTWAVKDGKIETSLTEYKGEKIVDRFPLSFRHKGEELIAERTLADGKTRITYSLKKNMVMKRGQFGGWYIAPADK